MLTIFLVCWYVDHTSGILTIFLVYRLYFWHGDNISGMLTIFLVCCSYFWYVDHISGTLTIFLVLWPYFWYVDHISGMLTLSLVLLVVFHSKGSTVKWSFIGSDMPSALGLVCIVMQIDSLLLTWLCVKMLFCRHGQRGPAWHIGSIVAEKVASGNPSTTDDYSSFLKYIDIAPAPSGPPKVPN